MYVLGIDSGGTKTRCIIANEQEQILADVTGGAAQHQIYGVEPSKESLRLTISKALDRAGITREELAYAVLGMSGADGEDDFKILNAMVGELLGNVSFEIVHDSWIGFRAAVEECIGVVSICGTGAGHAGQNRAGERLTLRNLDYITGNLGGGSALIEQALHYAFRSSEGTWDKTMLEEVIPSIFGVKDMDGACAILKNEEPTKEQGLQISKSVFRFAHEGDTVCQKLISDMGYQEGRYAAAVIRRLHMTEEAIPVVMIGSLFQLKDEILVEAYMRAVHEAAPGAYPLVLEEAPVMGAVRLAIDHVRAR